MYSIRYTFQVWHNKYLLIESIFIRLTPNNSQCEPLDLEPQLRRREQTSCHRDGEVWKETCLEALSTFSIRRRRRDELPNQEREKRVQIRDLNSFMIVKNLVMKMKSQRRERGYRRAVLFTACND